MIQVRFQLSSALRVLTFAASVILLTACDPSDKVCTENRVVVIGTNDIHGALEGMPAMGAAIQEIRAEVKSQFGNCGRVLALDGGDQFQGTLLSNYSEGLNQIKAMNLAGYDAAVPGNHDYDFGPEGWLEDRVRPGSADQNPRGAFTNVMFEANFPFLSANTYYRRFMMDSELNRVEVSPIRCKPLNPADSNLNWKMAIRLELLKPYEIFQVGESRVAVIGIDNAVTPQMTTPENVSDLCFRDEVEAYLEVRSELEGKADVFLMLAHQGNSNNSKELTQIVQKIVGARPNALHGVVAGHTHFVHKDWVGSVPLIQSGSSAQKFGRFDLSVDPKTKAVKLVEASVQAGIKVDPSRSDSKIRDLVEKVKKEIAPIAGKFLGTASREMKPERIYDSALAQTFTDLFRELSGGDVAILNSGGIRTSIKAGPITYADLFEVFPFNNHAMIVEKVSLSVLVDLFKKAIKTCGSSGVLVQSGLKIKFQRDCKGVQNGMDYNARLVSIESLSGELLYQSSGPSDPGRIVLDRSFKVATLDYLLSGGAGADAWVGLQPSKDLGIFREALVDLMSRQNRSYSAMQDLRFQEIRP